LDNPDRYHRERNAPLVVRKGWTKKKVPFGGGKHTPGGMSKREKTTILEDGTKKCKNTAWFLEKPGREAITRGEVVWLCEGKKARDRERVSLEKQGKGKIISNRKGGDTGGGKKEGEKPGVEIFRGPARIGGPSENRGKGGKDKEKEHKEKGTESISVPRGKER